MKKASAYRSVIYMSTGVSEVGKLNEVSEVSEVNEVSEVSEACVEHIRRVIIWQPTDHSFLPHFAYERLDIVLHNHQP